MSNDKEKIKMQILVGKCVKDCEATQKILDSIPWWRFKEKREVKKLNKEANDRLQALLDIVSGSYF